MSANPFHPHDPERIDAILSLLAAQWKRHPNQSLANILYNYTHMLDGDSNTNYHFEDSRLVHDLEVALKN